MAFANPRGALFIHPTTLYGACKQFNEHVAHHYRTVRGLDNIGFRKSVACGLGPFGVNVNVVAPGIVETDIGRALPGEVKARFVADIVLDRIGQPEDVAHLVTFLCSDRARHIHG